MVTALPTAAGDKMSCPLCRLEFVIPEGGLPALPQNVYVDTILDIQRRARYLKSTSAASAASVSSSPVDGARRCISVLQPSRQREDDWPSLPAADSGDFFNN